jgi:hypothetical protein
MQAYARRTINSTHAARRSNSWNVSFAFERIKAGDRLQEPGGSFHRSALRTHSDIDEQILRRDEAGQLTATARRNGGIAPSRYATG